MKNLFNRKIASIAIAIASLLVVVLPTVSALAAVTVMPNHNTVGHLTFEGSTTVGPIIVATASTYTGTTARPVTFTVDDILQNASGDGRNATKADDTDIGMSSAPKTGSTYDGLNTYAICRDAVCFITNSTVTDLSGTGTNITYITVDQIDKIFNGTYTNWNQIVNIKSDGTTITGPNLAITPRARKIGSGTRGFMKDQWGLKAQNGTASIYSSTDADSNPAPDAGTENALIVSTGLPRLEENQNVEDAISNTNNVGQIGYVGLGFTSGANIKELKVKSVGLNASGTYVTGQTDSVSSVAYPPTDINVYTTTYPGSRFLFLCTLPNDTTPSGTDGTTVEAQEQDYISWLTQTDGVGQSIVVQKDEMKLVPDKDVNTDGYVDVYDLISVGNQISANLGTGHASHWVRQDVKADGSIDVYDLIKVGGWVGTQITAAP